MANSTNPTINPTVNAVLLWQHHQTTTPYRPGPVPVAPAVAAVEPVEDVEVAVPPPPEEQHG